MPGDLLWREFAYRLGGPEGCNFRKDENGRTRWDCGGGRDQSKARRILTSMGLSALDVEETLRMCYERGGHCDCEILFNVDAEAYDDAEDLA